MRIVITSLALLLAAAWPGVVFAQVLSGYPQVIDGDTLDFDGTWVDLNGIDAPEEAQTCQRAGEEWRCGEEATAVLRGLVDGHEIACISDSSKADGTSIAFCSRGTLDLSAVMIEAGLAVAMTESSDAYRDAESLRQTHKIGLWASEFEMPEQWRLANPTRVRRPPSAVSPDRSAAAASNSSSSDLNKQWRSKWGCAIKGNRSRRGEWIYHLPGRPYYNQTKAEELFCTEAEARAAGYRRSKA